jgi:exopolyphosphatase/guanosine-5'-triphosphate,3'-diphosphate pyrophosphatase
MEKNYKLFAAIDLGSNAARMLIAQINKDGTYSVLEDLVKNINMGEEVFKSGYVEIDSMREVCHVLNGFKAVMKTYKVKQYRVVATSALRELQDREYIIDYIQVNTGFKIEVINYSEETFAKYKTIKVKCGKLLKENKHYLLLDVGAGGVEISIYKGKEIESSYHIKAGALRMRKFLEELESRTLNFDKVMQSFIYSKIYTIKNDIPQKGIDKIMVIGGESKTIANICNLESDEHGIKLIKKDKLLKFYDEIRKMLPKDITKKYNISEDSAEQILPTMILMDNMVNISGCQDIAFPFVSLKEGIVDEFIDSEINIEKKEKDLYSIINFVKNICRNYNYDEKHADYVQAIACALFDKNKKLHGLGERERFLLKIAAQIHDIGKYVNIDNHYIHSYNIINSLNIVGISDNERQIIANVARYIYLRDVDFEEDTYRWLTPKNRVLTAKLTAILQFADYMDIERKQRILNPAITLKNEDLFIKVNDDENFILEEWMLKTQATLLSNVFGLNIVFKKDGN